MTSPTPPKRRRPARRLLVALIVLVALVGVFFAVDAGLRSYAQNRIASEIDAGLPAGVSGDVDVVVGGASVIVQYLTGSFERVALTAPTLTVNDVPASVSIVATGVPTDTTQPVGHVAGTIDLDQAALNTLLQTALAEADADPAARNAELELGADQVTYTGELSVFGLPIGYEATATPSVTADSLVLTPTDARVTSGAGGLDLSGLLDLALGNEPISVCMAVYLPQGVTLTDVETTPERARITLESSTLTLTEQSLSTLGSCSTA
ncbi:LmeA family phospholipid-binding protein [Cryobacterium sp. N22]|uniref:LmeA family phospholipid-binding protein n=1 Tax=Cryobacterium sp. N22 TaxID=2048290 RepID=UPI000CE3962C|nr:LmeA family phospholipid-binding protein [Cryobacterium sp. N22]